MRFVTLSPAVAGARESDILHEPPVQLRPPIAEEAERGAVAFHDVDVDRRGDDAFVLAAQFGQDVAALVQMKLVP